MKFGLIPVKDLSKAKERLKPILSQDKRTDLAYMMLRDVLIAFKGSKLIDKTFVVTLDPDAVIIAAELGIDVIDESEQLGESASVDYATSVCMRQGASSVLVIPGDAPLVTSDDIDSILEKDNLINSVILVPSRDEMGTNAILRNPPDSIKSQFGHNSFIKHLEDARNKSLSVKIIKNPRIALDIDEPGDLKLFASNPNNTNTYKELESMGIISNIATVK